MARATKTEKQIHGRIEKAYRARCQNIQVPIMEIPKIFEVGRKAVAEGADDQVLGDKIAEFVDTIKR